MVPETLTTERFVLRRFARRDADSLHDAVSASLPDLGRWMPWAHERYGKEDAVIYIRDSGQSWKDGRAYDFAIRRPQQPDHHIGNVSIWTVSRLGRVAEIGYWTSIAATSPGFANNWPRPGRSSPPAASGCGPPRP